MKISECPGIRHTWVQILARLFISAVTFGKYLILSKIPKLVRFYYACHRVCIRINILFLNIRTPVANHAWHTVSPKLTVAVIITHLIMTVVVVVVVVTVTGTAYAIIMTGQWHHLTISYITIFNFCQMKRAVWQRRDSMESGVSRPWLQSLTWQAFPSLIRAGVVKRNKWDGVFMRNTFQTLKHYIYEYYQY